LGIGDVKDKIRIENLIFPEGLSIRAKNREYLTKKENGIFELI
jgi:site-specific DNA recombinase